MGGRRRSGRVGRSVKVAGLGLASVGLAGAMTLAGAQAAWALPGPGGPGPGKEKEKKNQKIVKKETKKNK
jgi:hypothetical protein